MQIYAQSHILQVEMQIIDHVLYLMHTLSAWTYICHPLLLLACSENEEVPFKFRVSDSVFMQSASHSIIFLILFKEHFVLSAIESVRFHI